MKIGAFCHRTPCVFVYKFWRFGK